MFKTNHALMALIVPAILSMGIPALAESTATSEVQKGAVNAVDLGSTASTEKKFGQGRWQGRQFNGGQFIAKGEGGGPGRQCGKGGHGGPGGRHGRHGGGHKHHISMLRLLKGQYALTDAQAEKIFALKGQYKEQVKPKVMDLMTANGKLNDLLTQPNADKAQLLALQNQINSDKDALASMKLERKLQEMNVLTDAQKQELRRAYVDRSIGANRS